MFIINSIKNTNPLILHQHGDLHHMYRWNRIANEIINRTNYIHIPHDVSIITFSTIDILNKSVLIKQLDKAGISYINCAEDFYGEWQNKFKIKLLHDFLPQVKSKYILSLDAADVLLSEDLTELITRFNKYNCKILFGASKDTFPPIDIDEHDRSTYGEWKYLNSGTMLGETAFVRDFYNDLSKEFDKNYGDEYDSSDQFRIRSIYRQYSNAITFDNKCQIFQTLAKTEYDLLADTLIFIGSTRPT